VGVAQRPVDALDAVTVASSLRWTSRCPTRCPQMIHRAPRLNAKVCRLPTRRAARDARRDGTRHRASGRSGAAATFGQCIDAVRALHVHMDRRHVNGQSDATVLAG